MKQFILILALPTLLVGCGQQLSYSGSKTTVGSMADVQTCHLLGSTKVSLNKTESKILDAEEIVERLEIEARNFAARIGANTVVPIEEVEEGRRHFKLYICQMDL